MPGLVPGIHVFKMRGWPDKPGWRRLAQVATLGIPRLSGTRSGRLRTLLAGEWGFGSRIESTKSTSRYARNSRRLASQNLYAATPRTQEATHRFWPDLFRLPVPEIPQIPWFSDGERLMSPRSSGRCLPRATGTRG